MLENALDYEGLKHYDGKSKEYIGKKVEKLNSEKVDKTTVATSSTLGLVKSGTDITVDSSGNVSVNDNSHKHKVSNISDLTATASELNVLDGITATTTELNYVDGVTSNIQTQLNSKVPTARKVNGKALSSDISLSASDVGADASGSASSAVSAHNTSTSAHSDIRGSISTLQTEVTTHKNTSNPHGISKSTIGLGSVENKSSATIRSEITKDNVTTALGYTPIDAAKKGASNGLAELDSNGKVPSSQLPSYVDDTIEGYFYNSKFYKESAHTTVITGEGGKIYIDLSTNKTYRWSGSAYVVISETLALGENEATAYRGDRGKIAYDHSQTAHAPNNAEKNQNAFSNVKVGNTTISADTTTDTLELAGSNVTITPDATADKVTIGITKDNVISALGYTPPTKDTQYAHPNSGVTAGTYRSVTVNAQGHVTAGSNPTLTVAQGGTGATDAATARSNLGITPANIGAAPTHSHLYAGSSTQGGAATLVAGETGANDVYRHVWFSDSSSETKRNYDDDFKYNPSTNTLSVANVSGKSATATKLATARTIALGTGATGTATSFDGSGNITIPVTEVKEAYLTSGGRNLSGAYSPIDAAMVPELGANRLAFMPAAGITVEYSQNGGSTWSNYSLSDASKIDLFNGNGTTIRIGNSTATKTDKSKYMVRVTIDTSVAQVYTYLNKFVIYCSTEGSTGSYCTIQGRTQGNYSAGTNTWKTFVDKAGLSGWSGYNVINTGFTTYGNTNEQYRQVRFTFGVTSHASSLAYSGLSITKIMGFGGIGWTTPSTMASKGRMYTYDASKNVTFPKKVKAESFEGALTGIASSANKLNTNAGSSTKGVYFADGKPVDMLYTLSADVVGYCGSLASGGWKALGGKSSGKKIYVAYNNKSASWNSDTYSSSIVFGCEDTKGLLDCGYNKPIVTFGGGSTGVATDDAPTWYFKLEGTSGKTYKMPSSDGTLVLTTGSITGSSGSCTGNSATATALTSKSIGSSTQPVYFDSNGKPVACSYTLGAACAKGVKTLSSRGHSNIGTNNDYLIDVAFISRWTGAYNSNNESNLLYCSKGAFGDAAIRGVDSKAAAASPNLITSGAMYTALNNKRGKSMYADANTTSINDLITDGAWRIYLTEGGEDANYLGWHGATIIESIVAGQQIFQRITKVSDGTVYWRYNTSEVSLSYDLSLITISNHSILGNASTREVDTIATASSANLITSGAMYTALAGKLGTSDAAASAKTVLSTAVNPTDASYAIPLHNGNTTGNKSIVSTNGFSLRSKNGTASAEGYITLNLGNTTATGTAGNKSGYINLYGTTTKKVQIKSGAPTGDRVVTLPDSNGTLSIASSDVRLKENIKDTEEQNALSVVNSIKFRQFDWKESGKHQKIGVIADELEIIDKHLVLENTGGYYEETDEDGNPMINVKCVDTFYLMGYYGKAIQELSALVKEQAKEIKMLKDSLK